MCWVRNWRKEAEHDGEQEAEKDTSNEEEEVMEGGEN